MVNVAGTSLRKSEFMNRRFHRHYRVGTSETYEHNQGRRRSRHNTFQVNAKKTVRVVTDRRSNAFFGDKKNSVFDRYEGVFGHCDGRGKRVTRN